MDSHLLTAAHVARLAYPSQRGRTLAGYGLHFLDAKPLQMVVAVSRTGTIIGLAGTNEAEDWVAFNFQLTPVQAGPVNMSSGSVEYASRAWRELQRFPELWQNKLLTVCGHSLGGAGAVAAPLVFQTRIHNVVTFGAPRCVHSGTSHCYPRASRVTRFARVQDIFPDLPLRDGFGVSMLTGWEHVGEVYWLHADGNVDTELSAWNHWKRRWKRFREWRSNWLDVFNRWKADHAMAGYESLIERNVR